MTGMNIGGTEGRSVEINGAPVSADNPIPVSLVTENIDLDIEASDLGAGAAGANCGNGVTQHLDNGAGKRVAALGDAAGHTQVDVLTLPAITGAVTTTGTVTEASASAIKTALEIIDDWDASDHCNIRHLVAADDVVGIGAGTAEIGNVKNTGTFAVQALVPFAAENLVPNATEADQALTVDATAAGVQFAALHANTTHVFWSLETASVRVTFDASTPTTTNGHLLQPGDSGVWSKALASAAKFIRTGATSGVVSASQMKGA